VSLPASPCSALPRSITATQPFYDGNGKLLGVFAADIPLTFLSEFISRIQIGKDVTSTKTMIVEE
jgi:hypothetical protein